MYKAHIILKIRKPKANTLKDVGADHNKEMQ